MKKNLKNTHFETRTVHAGVNPDPHTGTVNAPLHQTSAYAFDNTDDAASLFALEKAGYAYSRITNPTIRALEKRLANLENGVGGTCTSSGHAAQMLVFFALLKAGDNYIASKKLYGGTYNQMKNSFAPSFDWQVKFADIQDPESFKNQIDAKTKFIFVETISNPGGIIADIHALSRIAKKAGIPLIVDNTMATPFLCRPIDHGADIVVHSTTKYLSGHGNTIGGAVIDSGRFNWTKYKDKFPNLTTDQEGYQGMNMADKFGTNALTAYLHGVALRDLGCCQSPFNAWITLMGLETLHLRMERHCDNALKVAQFLDNHPAISQVYYPALNTSDQKTLQERYMPRGAAGIIAFHLKDGYGACMKVVNAANLASHVANLGDTKTLIIHPASTTHSQLSDTEKYNADTPNDLIRMSIGIEHVDDIIHDLEKALAVI